MSALPGSAGVPAFAILNFIGDEICAANAVFARDVLLCGSGEAVKKFDYFGALESCVGKCREIACRLQSARDSADPKIDIVAGGLR